LLFTNKCWKPEGFSQYQKFFPQTPLIDLDKKLDKSNQFILKWHLGTDMAAKSFTHLAHDTSIIFVKGYLGNCMPGNFAKPVKTLKSLGFDSFILQNKAGANVIDNVNMLAEQLKLKKTKKNLIFCGHSKGGMECLALLKTHEDIAARCIGLALSQTPSGPSKVIESILLKKHRTVRYSKYRMVAENIQRIAISLLRAKPGGLELSSDIWPHLVDSFNDHEWSFPVLQTASWSIQPTAWLDSFHTRLGEITPNNAHDGQFYINDLIWPNLSHILLPEVDHAQPVMGGHGFDCSRYWVSVLATLTDMMKGGALAPLENTQGIINDK
jgi:pimeloyl-ACP methyl ester carboxylesterase